MTGGLRDDLILDSTELYDPNLGSWVVAEARLPTPGYGLRAANINDRILIFGDYIYNMTKYIRKMKERLNT